MTFDLSSHDTKTRADEGVTMTLINPRTRQPELNDDKTPVTFTFHGQQSDVFQERMAQIQSIRATRQLRLEVTTAQDIEREDISLIMCCTMDWTPFSLDGAIFPCTPANVDKLWNDKRFITLRRTALAFIMNDANFLVGASTNSAGSHVTSSS